MCTVSYIPQARGCILTSNRDEHASRPNAHLPEEERTNGHTVVYPKDPKAGGTWFAAKDNGVVAVLLNGAFAPFVPSKKYVMSRGLVVLRIIRYVNPLAQLSLENLNNVAPFTLILFQEEQLFEFRWTGKRKYQKKLDRGKCHIWSSATLYSREVIRKREFLFAGFIKETSYLTPNAIVSFHSTSNVDQENGFIINRANEMRTFSITQAVLDREEILFNHIDLLKDDRNTKVMPLSLILNEH